MEELEILKAQLAALSEFVKSIVERVEALENAGAAVDADADSK